MPHHSAEAALLGAWLSLAHGQRRMLAAVQRVVADTMALQDGMAHELTSAARDITTLAADTPTMAPAVRRLVMQMQAADLIRQRQEDVLALMGAMGEMFDPLAADTRDMAAAAPETEWIDRIMNAAKLGDVRSRLRESFGLPPDPAAPRTAAAGDVELF